jgi:hypothetical protein
MVPTVGPIEDFHLKVGVPCRAHHKKSLCAENAEANSERNLYNPPSGLVLSFHVL